MNRLPRNNDNQSEILSSVDLPGKRVYFRMRNNSRIRRARLLVSAEEGLVIESPRRKLNLDHAHRVINRRKTWILDAIENVKIKQMRAFYIKEHLNSVLILGKEKTVHVRLGQSKNYVLENTRRIYLGFE